MATERSCFLYSNGDATLARRRRPRVLLHDWAAGAGERTHCCHQADVVERLVEMPHESPPSGVPMGKAWLERSPR